MSARFQRIALWLVFGLLVAVSVYGISSRKLLDQQIWTRTGLERLVDFAWGYSAWFLALSYWRRRWFAPLTVLVAAAYTVFAVGAPALLAAAFFLLSAFALGKLLLPDDGLLALLLGTALYVFLVSGAVHVPINYPAVYLAALAFPLAWNFRGAWAGLRAVARGLAVERPWPDHLLAGLAGFVLLAHWLVVLKPEAGGDALAMHLAVPTSVAFHHLWAFDFQQVVWAVMPMGADWAYTAVYLLGGEHAARLLNFALLLAMCALLFRAVRQWLPEGPGFLIVALFAATPVVQLVTGSLMAENLWAALLFGALLALARFHQSGAARDLLVCATLAGTALASKFGSLAFVVPLAFCAAREVVRHRKPGRWRGAAVALVSLAVFAAPPYLTAFLKTGNPVFPFLNATFRSPYFDASRSLVDYRFLTPLSWRTPFELAFHTSKYMEGQDGSWGFHYLLLTPLAFPLLSRRRWPYLGWLALVVGLLFSFFTLQAQSNLRYIYPAFPLFMILIALALAGVRVLDPLLGRAVFSAALAALALNIYFLPSSNWYHKSFFLDAFDPAATEAYLEDSAPVRKIIDYLNRKHPGEATAFFECNETAGLHGKAFKNTWHNDSFARQVRFAASAGQCLDLMNRLGVRNFVAPTRGGGVPLPQPSIRTFLDEFTVSEFTYGRYYLARLKDEFAGAAASERLSRLEQGLLPSSAGSYDDFSTRIRYSEGWIRDQQFPPTANGTLTYSNVPGAALRFLFQGTAITWIHTKASNRGKAAVLIDGVEKATVDLWAPEPRWQASITFQGLSGGPHEFRLRVLGSKNPRSSDVYVDVDSLVVK